MPSGTSPPLLMSSTETNSNAAMPAALNMLSTPTAQQPTQRVAGIDQGKDGWVHLSECASHGRWRQVAARPIRGFRMRRPECAPSLPSTPAHCGSR